MVHRYKGGVNQSSVVMHVGPGHYPSKLLSLPMACRVQSGSFRLVDLLGVPMA